MTQKREKKKIGRKKYAPSVNVGYPSYLISISVPGTLYFCKDSTAVRHLRPSFGHVLKMVK